jgi:zinc/manganese transport system substrate-binding protein
MSNSGARTRNRYLVPVLVIIVLLLVGAGAGIYLTRGSTNSSTVSTSPSTNSSSNGTVISVVAAENFWGSLVSQLGGVHVNVTSIVSDPNADPHEYQVNPTDAKDISNAKFIIVNGASYDTWALSMIQAAASPNQVVLNVQEMLNQSVTASNPHFWYSPYYVNDTVAAMYKDLVKMDPSDKAYFTTQYSSLNASLWSDYMKQETIINQEFSGAPVASTESIFVYMANVTGLTVVSPPSFMQAVAEDNDPSAQDIATMQNLMMEGNTSVRVLVYNNQTVTPLTTSLEQLATQHNIPVIAVTETIQPPNLTFQVWMQGEVTKLQNALSSDASGK